MGSDGHVIASDDIPQMFNFAASYELPVGQGRQFLQHGGLINSVVGGWKLTGNLNAESGVPLAVTAPCTLLQSSIAGNCRPNLLGNPSTKGESKSARIAQWIKPSAFEPAFGSDPTYWANPDPNDPRSWLFGNAPVRLSNLLSPGFWNLDSSLSKSFKIQGERSAEFRWEVYNSFNHPNPGLPNTSYCLPPTANGSTDLVHQAGCQFGQITNVQTDPRSMQFSLKFHL